MDNDMQILSLEERRRVNITRVTAVEAFTDEKIRLKTDCGTLIITGEKLKIGNFSEATGAFSCGGNIISLSFSAKRENFVKRLLK